MFIYVCVSVNVRFEDTLVNSMLEETWARHGEGRSVSLHGGVYRLWAASVDTDILQGSIYDSTFRTVTVGR